MGQVVIGNIKTEQISFINLGGQGCFRIVPEADWPDFAQVGREGQGQDGQPPACGTCVRSCLESTPVSRVS